MKYKNVNLYSISGDLEAISNEFNNAFKLYDSIEDSKSTKELVAKINKVSNHNNFIIDRETETIIRLKGADSFGNVKYLVIEKGE